MKVVGIRTALAVGLSFALAGAVGAEQPQTALFPNGATETLVAGPSEWGTATNIIKVIDASDLEVFFGASTNGLDGNFGHRFCTGAAQCGWIGGISLPSGAVLNSVELDACDTDAAAQVQIAVFRSVKGGGPLQVPALVNFAGTGATPGCSTFAANLSAPETINNLTNNYLVDILSGPNQSTRFRAIRLIYRLQVSPAPAAATFPADVPTTHPFFRFVEAMAASGLTGGCGAGAFCPDAPVTRGQLSVFLASALGLHFPN